MGSFADLLADKIDPPRSATVAEIEADYEKWLRHVAPTYVRHPFAPFHHLFWQWVWGITPRERPAPFVGIWSRGAAKSTSAEMAVAALGARRRRRYGIYVCGKQDKANDHVQNVGGILESRAFSDQYPAMGERRVGKYGSSQGWRRNRLRTSSGFTVDAIGLDTAARGVKIDEDRPDFIVIDDIDDVDDSLAVVEHKIEALTKTILPAGTPDAAVLAIQNIIHRNGVFARLAGMGDEPADFLIDRILSGPIPAVEDLETEVVDSINGPRTVITRGTPTWAGMDLQACQGLMDSQGITAFMSERQHKVGARSGGLWSENFPWQRCNRDEVPALLRVAVWVDPAVTNTDRSDSHAIQCDGLSAERHQLFRLRSWESRTTPEDSLARAIRWAVEEGAQSVGVETDQGGDTWRSVFNASLAQVKEQRAMAGLPPLARWPYFDYDKAGSTQMSKTHRVSQMLPDYERPGNIVHVRGHHEILEAALTRFPRSKPFDLADAAYWSWKDLMQDGGAVTVDSPLQRAANRPGQMTIVRPRRGLIRP